jgi:hypothetical protein
MDAVGTGTAEPSYFLLRSGRENDRTETVLILLHSERHVLELLFVMYRECVLKGITKCNFVMRLRPLSSFYIISGPLTMMMLFQRRTWLDNS